MTDQFDTTVADLERQIMEAKKTRDIALENVKYHQKEAEFHKKKLASQPALRKRQR